MYSLAGLRVGYGIANKGIIECLNKVREPFNVNSIAQIAALEALRDTQHVKRSVRLVDRGKAYLYRELEKIGFSRYDYALRDPASAGRYIPSATNFILVKVKGDSKLLYKKLLKKGVIVREMSPWRLRGFIRVTIGTMRENVRFVNALKRSVL